MTKLMEWITALVLFLSIYIAIVSGQIKLPVSETIMFQIKIFPITAIALFGVSPLTITAK